MVGVLNISSGPFLSYEIELGDGPGPELDNNLLIDNYYNLKMLIIFLSKQLVISRVIG